MFAVCRNILIGIKRSYEIPLLTRTNLTETNIKPAFRTFLSALYVSKSDAEVLVKPHPGADELAKQTLSLDRCHERDMPVSSLMVDKMIRLIDNKEHLKGSLYYMYKFRHSLNGYYLQPWTVFSFLSKCLEIDAEVVLGALRDKMQYGIFPNQYMMNLIVDHFLETNNLEGALKGVTEMFLLETLDNKIAQVLALHTIAEFWKQTCQNGQLIPEFKNSETKRNIAAVLFIVGSYLSQPSLIIIGNSLLGSIEIEQGIRAVYQDPWGPLSTEPGYLNRAIRCLETSDTPISQQSVDILLQCSSANEELKEMAQNAVQYLQSKNLISNGQELKMDEIAKSTMKNLPKYEEEERGKITDELKIWKSDCDLLQEIEQEILAEFKEARESHFRKIAIDTKAHQMAVETLGYWDFEKGQEKDIQEKDNQPEENPLYYLRKDYVEGAMDDLDLVERFREKRDIVNDPVILIS